MKLRVLYQIWSGRDDFDRAVADAMALFAPPAEPAPVVDLFAREALR